MAAPKSPTSLRTSRNRALAIGTAPAGFTADVEYCAQCGFPTTPGMMHSHYENQTAHSHYDDKAKAAQPVDAPASAQPKPFAVR